MNSVTYKKVIKTCWQLAEGGLLAMTPAKIAETAGVDAGELETLFPEPKNVILALLNDIKAHAVVPDKIDSLTPDDQLFDAIMAFYDAAQPHHQAIKKLWAEIAWNPALSFGLTPHFQAIVDELTTKYYTDQNPLVALGRKLANQFLVTRVFHVWLEDESFDQSKTMAALDQGIKTIKDLVGLKFF